MKEKPPPKEQQTTITINWILIKNQLGNWLFEDRVAGANIIYELGHAGRGFDDFPHEFNVTVPDGASVSEFPKSSLYKQVADHINSYIERKLQGSMDEIVKYFREKLLAFPTSYDDLPTEDQFSTFLKELESEFQENKEKRIGLMREHSKKIMTLAEIATITALIRFRISLKESSGHELFPGTVSLEEFI